MTDAAAFIAAIDEAPEDDAPRLVYADWLDETGAPLDAAHAQLIRAQCELARDFPNAPPMIDLAAVAITGPLPARPLAPGDEWEIELHPSAADRSGATPPPAHAGGVLTIAPPVMAEARPAVP